MDYLDHIGIAVKNLDAAIAEYSAKFGFKADFRETLPSQGVELAFLSLANTKLELLAPLSEKSTLTKFLATRGPGLHHICYRVKDIRAELEKCAARGMDLIDKEPRKGAHNTLIAFIHPKSCAGVLTELCEYVTG